jgi:general secretion pathway protein G
MFTLNRRELERRLAMMLAASKSRRGRRKGMSLVEVMVVIAIILTLMGIVGYGVFSVFNESRVDTTNIAMAKVAERVQMYQLRHGGKPPSTSQGLKSVYMDTPPPRDSWGNDFVYVTPGPKGMDFDIMSYGADGSSGGTGTDADLKFSILRSGGNND